MTISISVKVNDRVRHAEPPADERTPTFQYQPRQSGVMLMVSACPPAPPGDQVLRLQISADRLSQPECSGSEQDSAPAIQHHPTPA